MQKEFVAKVSELVAKGEAFATATVVNTRGSTSAKSGAKAIIKADGSGLFGWVGGGCVESAVAEAALTALKDGQPKFLDISLEDEVSGAGMPCGGSMSVYVEPFLPKPQLVILGHGAIAENLSSLGALLDFEVVVNDPAATRDKFPDASQVLTDDIDLKEVRISPQTYVVVATQHKNDDRAVKKALEAGAPYIALIASRKRTGIVFRYLIEDGVTIEKLKNVRAPSGLDIGAVSPPEIALSILSEIISMRRGGTGRPMTDLRGVDFDEILRETQRQDTSLVTREAQGESCT